MIKQLYSNKNVKLMQDFVYLVFVNGTYERQLSKPGILDDGISLNDDIFSLIIPSCKSVYIRILNIKTDYQNSSLGSINFKLIKCSSNSEVVFLQSFHGFDGFVYYNRSSMKLDLEENSKATIYNIVDEGNKGSHIGDLFATQSSNTCLETYRLTSGGDIISDSVVSVLSGEKSTFISMGLYTSIKKESRIMSSRAHHISSDTESNQVYNGIADDYSSSSFLGEILIDSGIQSIEAHQKNKNLMVSENCSMSSHPELRIDSDSVKCSHGSTVGQIDKEAIFYMKSRGIDQEVAKKILVESFRNSIIKNISDRHILKHVNEMIQRK